MRSSALSGSVDVVVSSCASSAAMPATSIPLAPAASPRLFAAAAAEVELVAAEDRGRARKAGGDLAEAAFGHGLRGDAHG